MQLRRKCLLLSERVVDDDVAVPEALDTPVHGLEHDGDPTVERGEVRLQQNRLCSVGGERLA